MVKDNAILLIHQASLLAQASKRLIVTRNWRKITGQLIR